MVQDNNQNRMYERGRTQKEEKSSGDTNSIHRARSFLLLKTVLVFDFNSTALGIVCLGSISKKMEEDARRPCNRRGQSEPSDRFPLSTPGQNTRVTGDTPHPSEPGDPGPQQNHDEHRVGDIGRSSLKKTGLHSQRSGETDSVVQWYDTNRGRPSVWGVREGSTRNREFVFCVR